MNGLVCVAPEVGRCGAAVWLCPAADTRALGDTSSRTTRTAAALTSRPFLVRCAGLDGCARRKAGRGGRTAQRPATGHVPSVLRFADRFRVATAGSRGSQAGFTRFTRFTAFTRFITWTIWFDTDLHTMYKSRRW